MEMLSDIYSNLLPNQSDSICKRLTIGSIGRGVIAKKLQQFHPFLFKTFSSQFIYLSFISGMSQYIQQLQPYINTITQAIFIPNRFYTLFAAPFIVAVILYPP